MPKKMPRSKRLHLVHHRHTGRKLHRRHTSYPLVGLLLLSVGVFLSVLSMQVRAVDVVVQAAVNGDPPTVPAVILSPVTDARFTVPTVSVSGTCDPYFFVKIYRNDIFAGSGECSPGGDFTVTIQLFPGRNDLVARTFNVAELEGPPSNTVTVYYDAPVPPPRDGPFYLTTEYFFRAAYTGQKIIWDFGITGGSSPYTVTVSWGDGSSDTITNLTSKSFRLEHLYRSPKNQREFFTVTVTVTDADKAQASLQLVAIMNDPDIIGASFAEPDDPAVVASPGTLRLLWLAFAVTALMGICFYLGERRGQALTDNWYRRHLAR